jgi:hypothetical protein
MDKDDYFKILEDVCLFNLRHFGTDSEWITQNSLSYNQRRVEKDILSDLVNNKNEENKINRIEMNAMKYYE